MNPINERRRSPAVWMAIALTILGACKDDDEQPANRLPEAAFLVSNLVPGAGETVSFTDQSVDDDGEIIQWHWDFGNGATSQEQNPTAIYETEGSFTVKLTVTDNSDGTAEAVRELTVSNSNLAPTAAFSVKIEEQNTEMFVVVMPDSLISFTDESEDIDGSIVSWSWDLGDGTTSASRNVEHSYTNGGAYTVSLTVTDDEGETNISTKKVYVPVVKWTAPVNGMESGSPAIDGEGNIYLGDRNSGTIYKLSKENGSVLWTFAAGGGVRSSIVLSDDDQVVYAGSQAMKFYAINAVDGSEKWSVDVDGEVDKSSAALDENGNLYFGTSNGTLYSLKAADGSQNWVFDGDIADESIQSSPLFHNGKVMVAIGNKLFGVQASTGSKTWEYAIGGARYEGHFAMDDNGILYGGSENTDDKSGRVYAINVATGNEVWSKQLPGEVRANSPILGPDGILYVTTEDGVDEQSMAIHALNASSGAAIWASTVVGDDLKVAPTLGKSGILYVGSNDDYFYLISSLDGSLICKFSHESADHSIPPTIGADGTVYFGSRGSLFFAMKILDDGEEALPGAGWPIVGGNLKHQNRK